jgi:hypothetical protein
MVERVVWLCEGPSISVQHHGACESSIFYTHTGERTILCRARPALLQASPGLRLLLLSGLAEWRHAQHAPVELNATAGGAPRGPGARVLEPSYAHAVVQTRRPPTTRAWRYPAAGEFYRYTCPRPAVPAGCLHSATGTTPTAQHCGARCSM